MSEAWGAARVGIAFACFALIGAVEAALGVLLPSLLHTFHLSTASVTLLLVSQIGGCIVASLLSGALSQRLGLGRMLLLALVLLLSALVLYAVTPGWSLMVGGGIAVGMGIGLIDAGINTAVAQQEAAARLIGPLHGFYGLGAFAGPAIATMVLALGGGWRLVYGVLAAVVGLLLLVVGRHRRVGLGPRPLASAAGDGRGPLQALRSPPVRLSALVLLSAVGLEASIGTWAYSVENLGRAQPAMTAGLGVSLYWLGLTLGRFCFGGLVARLGLIRSICGSLALLLAALISWTHGVEPLVALPALGFALAGLYPATILLIPRRLPASLVPAAVGIATSAASFGSVALPSSLGWIAADLGLAAVPALLLPPLLALASLYGLFLRTPALPCASLPFPAHDGSGAQPGLLGDLHPAEDAPTLEVSHGQEIGLTATTQRP